MEEIKKPWDKVKASLSKRGLARTHVDISERGLKQLRIAAIEDGVDFRVILNEAVDEYLKIRYARKVLAKN